MVRWDNTVTLQDLETLSRQTAAQHCGIEFTGIGNDWVEATIPLDARTRDSEGMLHPGALGILAETIGSIAASLCIDNARRICVGQILHVNHPATVGMGPIRAKASAVSILEDRQVWDVEMWDPNGATVCVAHLTMAILERVDR